MCGIPSPRIKKREGERGAWRSSHYPISIGKCMANGREKKERNKEYMEGVDVFQADGSWSV
jgi:hypothetical protein